ncbi:Methyltransferase domain-containing protein [Streptoalloteichus tenebrarius]|uniref:Methyltransferase domain-containing protein n=1 Tax=Streptoalloteichus tenebrarius (strain ATCC 17920 / DSM 40477 / JCM 4838 / CBS 697.72 / NBRC 16177 / NCIMB 11028 / NRRL B-12390 / A12253. 1 / ISP 5477) TaxID=1933 RepID=A0ABT1HLM5_STRSD|nr:class I SAM-dependent methyltransferase [Streptoalloteichus tenebrarius]MCP2256395.1 Methyltransferase domain-containing protein [Streptoalloteichus tenebrarius]BFF04743.1 class I SAM-dependent methyltransferase [Streptoalloteichus tenebrarius]
MVDRAYSDSSLAELYDLLNPWGASDDFYLELVMAAGSVLDVGCGTGTLLRRAREVGHRGRLCGLDPAGAMLDRARRRTDVEWVQGDLTTVSWDREFDLVVMTGHAFQVLLGDEELRDALTTVAAALVPGGRFAFETRNPLARPWERWNGTDEVRDGAGDTVRVTREVETPVTGDVVHFTETFTCPRWEEPRVSRSSLRFVDVDALGALLGAAGLVVEDQFGDWSRAPLTTTSREIITIAKRPSSVD